MATKDELMTPVEMPKMQGKEAKSFNDVIGLTSPFVSKQSQIMSGITKAEGDILAGEQKQKEMIAEGELTGTAKQAETVRSAQEKYQAGIEKEPIPAFIPTKDTVQDIAGLFSMISVISMIAGKNNAQLALGNMNGMLEGYQKGRADLYKKEATEFDKNFKTVLKKHEELRKEMEDAIKLAPYDKEAAIAEANMAAIKAGSKIVKAKIDKGDLVGAYDLTNDSKKLIVEAKKNYDRHMEHVATEAAAERRQKAAFTHAEEMARIKKTEDEGGKEKKRLEKVDPAIRNKLVQYPNYNTDSLVGIPTASQKNVVESFDSLASIEQIGKYVRANPDAVGLLADLANKTNVNTLDSLATWSQMVNSTPDMPESARVLNKMLTTQAYRDVSATGQRPTVYLDKVFKDIYGQNSSPTALLAVLKERGKEANKILSRYDLELENNVNRDRYELYKQEPREYMKSSMFVAADGKKYNALQVEETAKKYKKSFSTVVRELGLKAAGEE